MPHRVKAATAINIALRNLLGDLDRVHPEVRRHAVELLEGDAASLDVIDVAGAAVAKVIAALHIRYDCSEMDERCWAGLSPLYREFGDLMVVLGLTPLLIWPSHDVHNAPPWAEVANRPRDVTTC